MRTPAWRADGRATNPKAAQWNFDADNRAGVWRRPGRVSVPPTSLPSRPTTLRARSSHWSKRSFADASRPPRPASTGRSPPRMPKRALERLRCRIALGSFGRYQDAMWEGEPWLYHSRLGRDEPQTDRPPGGRVRGRAGLTVKAGRHWRTWRGLSGRSWDGASMCEGSIGCTCRVIWSATS